MDPAPESFGQTVGLAIRQFCAIAALTALEIVRQPIVLLLTAACAIGIGLMPILITHTLGESQKMVIDSALALQFAGGMLLGAYAACATLTREIRRGTASAVLCKPVSRGAFFLAKYAGLAVSMMAFSFVSILATLLSARMAANSFVFDWWGGGPLFASVLLAFVLAGFWNYRTRRPFASAAFFLILALLSIGFAISLSRSGPVQTPLGERFLWAIVPAGALVAMAILLLSAIAVTLATRLDAVPNLSLCSIAFLVGLMSDYLFGRHAASSRLAAALYALTPNWQHFWVVDALHNGIPIPWAYVAHAAGYAAVYLAGILLLGMACFRHMEVR